MAFTPATVPPVGPQHPGTTPLSFGAVAFNSEECPSRLVIGHGAQMKSVVELIGGGRAVQTFGAQPQPVTISGTLWNVNVVPRITLLRSYCVAGTEQLLTWYFERYYGVLMEFEPNYYNTNRCDYKLTIEITRDANGAFTTTSPTSVNSQVAAINANAATTYGALLTLDPST